MQEKITWQCWEFGYQDFDNRVAGGGEEQEYLGFKSWAGNTKLIYQPNEAHELLLDMQDRNQPKTPRYDELVPGYGQNEPSSDGILFQVQRTLVFAWQYRDTQVTAIADSLEFHSTHQRITNDHTSVARCGRQIALCH